MPLVPVIEIEMQYSLCSPYDNEDVRRCSYIGECSGMWVYLARVLVSVMDTDVAQNRAHDPIFDNAEKAHFRGPFKVY